MWSRAANRWVWRCRSSNDRAAFDGIARVDMSATEGDGLSGQIAFPDGYKGAELSFIPPSSSSAQAQNGQGYLVGFLTNEAEGTSRLAVRSRDLCRLSCAQQAHPPLPQPSAAPVHASGAAGAALKTLSGCLPSLCNTQRCARIWSWSYHSCLQCPCVSVTPRCTGTRMMSLLF